MDIMFQTCPRCKKPETVYRKTYYENGTKLDCPNKFYFCENEDCLLSMHVETEKKIFIECDNISFEWIKIYDPTLPSLWSKGDSTQKQASQSEVIL